MHTSAERPLRADARRNREAILEAARKVFGKHGATAQMDDIARSAKVGVGTLYRHFPTKDALFKALALDHFEQVTAGAREAELIDDPWEAFEAMLMNGARLISGDRALAEIIANSPTSMAEARAEQQELFTIGARVMKRGQDAGVIRQDADPSDIGLVMRGLCVQCGDGAGSERFMRIALDGFRPRR